MIRRHGPARSLGSRTNSECIARRCGPGFAREEIDNGDRPGTTTDEAKRIAELERENRELRRANEILKTASAFSRQRSSTANCVTDSGLREYIRLSAAADTTVLDAAADRLVEAYTRRLAASA